MHWHDHIHVHLPTILSILLINDTLFVLNEAFKNEAILISFGTQSSEKININYWRCPHSMRCRVSLTVGCPSLDSSVCLSVCPVDRHLPRLPQPGRGQHVLIDRCRRRVSVYWLQHARFLQRIYPSGNISRKILWDMRSVSRLLQTLYRWIYEWWSSRIGNHLWYHHKNSSTS